MFHSRITPAALTIEAVSGFPHAIDELAHHALSQHHFLRAAWFAAAAPDGGETLLARRENGDLIAAIPTTSFGPRLIGARKVPGSYWPFRGILAASDATRNELAAALSGRAAQMLGPIWRLGPVPQNDPTAQLLIGAAREAGWHVLTQTAGTVWVFDLDEMRCQGWPRPSTAKRMGRLERRLGKAGCVEWRHVRGNDWDEATLEALGETEAASWIASKTDGSGAKFLHPHQRAVWRNILSDRQLAEMLCATILMVDGRVAAFSLDLDDGAAQYGIAGTYHREFAKYEVGKLVNHRTLIDAIEDGQSVLDMGAGDSGYKGEMGAVPTYDLNDLLFVRNPVLAGVLGPWWRRQGV